jgi:glucosamine--fructose-6-phosphate aminotransferase (isomerizing)
MVQRGFPVLVVAPSGKTVGPMREFLSRLRDRDAESLVISNEPELLAAGTKQMRLPEGLAEWLSPIAAVIPGQIFAMLLAGAKGNPIDKPVGLSKVTVTL